MTSRIGNPRTRTRISGAKRRAFTLIELILVMALLTIVISVAAPSLSGFFRGRTLESEARQFLSLTRYGQSRAASDGVPMTLWIDVAQRTYGLRADPAFVVNDPKAAEFQLAKNLRFQVTDPRAMRGNQGRIRFLPDGSISETSLDTVVIENDRQETIGITRDLYQLNYEIRSESHVRPPARP